MKKGLKRERAIRYSMYARTYTKNVFKTGKAVGGERILNLGALKRTDKRSLGAVLTADTAGWFVLSLSLTFPRAGPDGGA